MLCLPLYTLDVLGDDAIPLDGIAPALRSGFACIVRQSGSEGCESAWVYVAVWLGMMYLFNALMTRLISQSGATLMFAVNLSLAHTPPHTHTRARAVSSWDDDPGRTHAWYTCMLGTR